MLVGLNQGHIFEGFTICTDPPFAVNASISSKSMRLIYGAYAVRPNLNCTPFNLNTFQPSETDKFMQ